MRNSEQGIWPICGKEGDWSHILRSNGTRNSRHQILDKRFRNMDSEMGIRWILRCKNKDKWQKT
jgi:hypothetical protein